MSDYYDAWGSDEAAGLRTAMGSAIEDYVRYFESQGFQIHPSWIADAQFAVQYPKRIGKYAGIRRSG